ncbi:unnamed protein product [Phaedon cochleariae]|uniref:Endonuclease-reverse transcriptase n=1 Tax=Phaedon cochleariae TaxID=80249 RepID=A0A9P0DAD0_PHACE|nr:unnamed protein product [Phaedon cochleariae]
MSSTRSKLELQSIIKDTITELFSSEEFVISITKTIAARIEQKIRQIEEDVKTMNDKMKLLEIKVDSLQQQERINNICIYGVNEETGENLKNKVAKLLNENIDSSLQEEHLIDIYRVGKINSRPQGKTRPIIVKLISYDRKLTLLKNIKKLKGKNMFITEDLVKNRQTLLMKSKDVFGKQNAWSFNGQIYVKIGGKTEKIYSHRDIEIYSSS